MSIWHIFYLPILKQLFIIGIRKCNRLCKFVCEINVFGPVMKDIVRIYNPNDEMIINEKNYFE